MIIKALQKASEFNEISNMPWIRQLFERVQRIPGANQLFKRIASAPDSNQYADYFAEVIYALVFAGLRFDVAIEPPGSKGPDMEVRRDAIMRSLKSPVSEISFLALLKSILTTRYCQTMGTRNEMYINLLESSYQNFGKLAIIHQSLRYGMMMETLRKSR